MDQIIHGTKSIPLIPEPLLLSFIEAPKVIWSIACNHLVDGNQISIEVFIPGNDFACLQT
jgi:hypothetical protein